MEFSAEKATAEIVSKNREITKLEVETNNIQHQKEGGLVEQHWDILS